MTEANIEVALASVLNINAETTSAVDEAVLAASGNDSSLAASGENSLCMAARFSTVSAGPGSALAVEWHDGKRRRIAVAYVGENGIKPNTVYSVSDSGEFVEVV